MTSKRNVTTLSDDIIDVLARRRPNDVGQLVKILQEKRGRTVSFEDVAATIHELQIEKKVELWDGTTPRLLRTTIWNIRANADFWIILLGVALATTLSAFPENAITSPFRVVLGLAVAVLFPGYSIQMLLFPLPRELELWKRIILSIGFSIALIAFYSTILDFTAVGITQISVSAVLSLHSTIFALLSVVRRLHVQGKANSGGNS